jgi:hypothetical protein
MPSIRTVIIHDITSPKFKASVFRISTRAARWGARIGYEESVRFLKKAAQKLF